MGQLFCNRLSSNGQAPQRLKHTTYHCAGGMIALRNARITDHHWSTINVRVAEHLHHDAESQPVVYVLTYWAIAEGKLHAWTIPEDVAHIAFEEIPTGKDGTYKTLEVFPDTHSVKNAPNAPGMSDTVYRRPFKCSGPLRRCGRRFIMMIVNERLVVFNSLEVGVALPLQCTMAATFSTLGTRPSLSSIPIANDYTN